jgi:NAD(P)-dependent dehydrogenase (short-subunit alcohol dehydrogenase family)
MIPDPSEFGGKRVLVTGGTKGAGKAIADRFLQGGATVIVTARSAPEEQAERHFIQADVSTAEGTSKVIREILDRFEGIDIIIHNVGGSSAPSGGFITVTDELWQQAINENLFPAVRLDRGLLPSMLARGSGVIIHIFFNSTVAASLRFNSRLCRSQSCFDKLQQGTIERSQPERRAGGHCFARFYRDGCRHKND